MNAHKYSFNPKAPIEAEGLLNAYIARSEECGIDMRDTILFAMASLFDHGTATKKQFIDLAKLSIRISMRENEGVAFVTQKIKNQQKD